MISYEPIGILFSIGRLHIRIYAVALVAAIILGFIIGRHEIKKRGLNVDEYLNISLFAIYGAIIVARLLFVLENIQLFIKHPFEIIEIWKGGAASFGGFLGAFLFTVLYSKKRKLNLWPYLDAMVPGICMGIFITRIGCFLNWDDYGIASNLPWAVNAGDFPRHPTQLYLAINGLFFFFFFFRDRYQNLKTGKKFLLFVLSYNSVRFFIEILRDEPRFFFHLTMGQIIGVILIILSAAFLHIIKSNPAYLDPND
jgi:phosphatidylglycerol:prolipoprotein diacylglycerol transferase